MPASRFGDEMIAATVSAGRIRAAGLDVAYDRAGEGPPLVLVHGGAGDAREWRPQLTGLADDFTVIAWDEPGAGRSSDVPADFRLAGYATALAALVETLPAPAHVCGLSWGGTVTLELYRRRPELVATLVLADTYAGWKGSLPKDEVRARVAGAERMLAAPSETFRPSFPGLFAAEPPGDVIDLLDAVAADVRRESLRVALAAMAEADLRDVLPSIAVPTLLLWGEFDARSPLRVAREFAQAIPHAELVIIPGAGHMSNLEHPEEFNAAIRAFCGRVP
jgi:pimeloyl-ACP methyl ester carboxylesterase